MIRVFAFLINELPDGHLYGLEHRHDIRDEDPVLVLEEGELGGDVLEHLVGELPLDISWHFFQEEILLLRPEDIPVKIVLESFL